MVSCINLVKLTGGGVLGIQWQTITEFGIYKEARIIKALFFFYPPKSSASANLSL